MFNEDEDWSDDGEPQAANKATAKEPQTNNSTTKLKTKSVGKKSLLRTLQTLGSVPEWENEDHQEDSDSEVEAAPAPVKKKKRRKKKRRHAETSGEQGENGDAEESVQEESSAPPKKKKKDAKPGTLKAKSASAATTEEKKVPDSDQPNANKPEDTDRLSRQQWKNKMKNRRKCKNRYRQDQPEGGASRAADKQELKEEVEMDSDRKDGSEKTTQVTLKKEKKVKAQKTEKSTQNLKKQLIVNKGNANISDVGKSASESAVDRSKQKPPESKTEIPTDRQQISIRQKAEQSKAQSLKRERLRKLLQGHKTAPQESPAEQGDKPVEPEGPEEAEGPKPSEASSFRARMEQRLDAARFRYINEVLYSTSSGEAKRMFKQDPQAFWVYHKGYTAQVQRWPANPVDSIIAYIHKRAPSLVVADFGCGDCKIARSVKNKVHSFDLAATCELVTVCDMAHVPLEDGSVDIAVFCLSLMGTNLVDFLSEANRVLKNGGVLKVAEVASRFDNVRNFITALARLGFKMASKDTENTHFYSFEFEKTGTVSGSGKKLGLQLKPCLYKKR